MFSPSGVCVIFNPAARGEKARRFRSHFEQMSAHCVLKPTTGAGAARLLAAEAVREGHHTIVAAGGDGTLNEVLNGIVDAPNGIERVRLGVLPLGTINVFARELRLPTDLRRAWSVIEKGREVRIDIPQTEFMSPKGIVERRCFLQLAGAGWDARAIQLLSWEWKKKIGPAAYVVAGLQAINHPQSTITVSNGKETASGELVIIGNGKLYGGTFPLFHQADYQDRVLDAVVLDKVNWGKVPGILWDWISGGLYKPGVNHYMQGPEMSLTSDTPALLQLEGELVGELPARVGLLTQQLRVLAPS